MALSKKTRICLAPILRIDDSFSQSYILDSIKARHEIEGLHLKY